jgi:hypothetical protein
MLYPEAANRRTTASIIAWWEARRPTYNLIVGSAGLLSLGVVRIVTWLPPHIAMPIGWQPIVVFGVMANVCYSLGWVLETAAQRLWGDRVRPLGPPLFRQGVAFSVGLTLLPIVLASVTWVIRGAVALFR